MILIEKISVIFPRNLILPLEYESGKSLESIKKEGLAVKKLQIRTPVFLSQLSTFLLMDFQIATLKLWKSEYYFQRIYP